MSNSHASTPIMKTNSHLMKIGRREFAARNMWHNYHYHLHHHMWYLCHTGKVLAGTDDMEMTMGARMALAGVIFLRLIPYTVWTRNMLWSQKINVNLLSKYQLLPAAEVRETDQTQLLCLVDNYCEVFLGILSILAVGGISVYLSGENLDHLLYALRANSLKRGHFNISLVWKIILFTIFTSADRVYDATHPSSWQTLYISDHHLWPFL